MAKGVRRSRPHPNHIPAIFRKAKLHGEYQFTVPLPLQTRRQIGKGCPGAHRKDRVLIENIEARTSVDPDAIDRSVSSHPHPQFGEACSAVNGIALRAVLALDRLVGVPVPNDLFANTDEEAREVVMYRLHIVAGAVLLGVDDLVAPAPAEDLAHTLAHTLVAGRQR